MDATKLNIAAMINAGMYEQRVAKDEVGGTFVGVTLRRGAADADPVWHIIYMDAAGSTYMANRAQLTTDTDIFCRKWTDRGTYVYVAT